MDPGSGNIAGPERVKTSMHHLALSEVERLQAAADEATDVAFAMDEDAFRAFYDRTSRALWGYLSRMTGDGHLADDLLQDTYYRFLRAKVEYEGEAHRRNYLFRIATNLVRDSRRRQRTSVQTVGDVDFSTVAAEGESPAAAARSADLRRALAQLKPREREMLWLAYAQGSSHKEIGDVLGLKTGSIKLLLFRARRKLAGIIGAASQREASHETR